MQLAMPSSLARPLVFVLAALVLALVAYDVYWLVIGLDQPILGSHAFRQTQTAISAYWLKQGGPLFAYETPVVGAPWSIPFEFPLYQWLVALLSLTGLSIEVSGRLIAFGFFLGCLWPMRMLCRQYKLPDTTFLFAAALFLASPIYTFWSRTLMIETTALFFAMVWLALFARALDRQSVLVGIATFVCGTGSVLAKSTTFPAFVVCAFCLFVARVWPLVTRRKWRHAIGLSLLAGIVTLGPLAVGSYWVHFSDIVKLRSPGGTLLTSSALTDWNFGAWDARFSAKLWVETIGNRVANDSFGKLAVVALILTLFALTQRRYVLPTLICLLGFLTPFLLFTNLHTTHNYYQVANVVFAIGACALGIQALFDRAWIAGIAVLVLVLASQISFFGQTFGKEVVEDFTTNEVYQIGQIIQQKTPDNSVIVVFGQDWSSAVPYEGKRRGVVLATWFPRTMFEALVQQPDALLGSLSLGGIVDCGTNGYDDVMDLVGPYLAGRSVLGEAGKCRLLSPVKP
ncbi:hypothetical protein C3941_07250 [Kaistia algarum]|nr:hypothetical protein C3941_07250 [Kaistia algarum]